MSEVKTWRRWAGWAGTARLDQDSWSWGLGMQDQRKVQGRHTPGASGQLPPSVHRMLHSFLFWLVTGSSFPPSFRRKVSLVCRGLSHEFPFHLPEIACVGSGGKSFESRGTNIYHHPNCPLINWGAEQSEMTLFQLSKVHNEKFFKAHAAHVVRVSTTDIFSSMPDLYHNAGG